MSPGPIARTLRVLSAPRRSSFPVGFSLVMAVGCGGGGEITLPRATGDPIPVKGRVFLPGGRPLAGGRVVFVPAKGVGGEATGKTGDDGSFRLTTKQDDDGALPGDYKVKIESPPAPKGATKLARPPFASEYLDEDASGLTATVSPEKSDFEFKLKSSLAGSASKRRGGRD